MGTELCLPATGQPAAHFVAVTVALFLSTVLNDWLVLRAVSLLLMAFLTRSNNWAYQRITRDHFPRIWIYELTGLMEEKKKIQTFTFESFSFYMATSECKLDPFFSYVPLWMMLLHSPLTKKKRGIAENLISAMVSWSHKSSVGFLSHRPTWHLHLVLMWPSHGLALKFHAHLPLIKCIIMNCVCILEQTQALTLYWRAFFPFIFSNETPLCCEDWWWSQNDLLCVCLAQKSMTLDYWLVSYDQVMLTFPGRY